MDDFFLNLLLNVFLTAIAYTAFPLIRICINHGRFSKKRAKRIALWNSVIVGFIFCIFTIVLSESGTTWNAAPAFLYYWINRAILTDKYLSDDEEMNKQPEPEEQPVTPICPQHNSEQNIHSSNYVNCNVNDEDIRTVVSKSTIQHTSTQYESVSKVKPSIAFCRKCGNKLTEHAIFCHKCGCPIYTPVFESDNSACADDITPSMVTQDKVFSVQPVQKIKSKKNKKSAAVKYCSKCGALIDCESKKCTGCGKQYFKGIKLNKFSIIVLVSVILIIVLIVLNIIQNINNSAIKDELEALGGYKDSVDKTNESNTAILDEKYNEAVSLMNDGKTTKAAMAFGSIGNYKDAKEKSFNLWEDIAVRNTIAAGEFHTVGVKTDGMVVAVGGNGNGQCNVESWTDIIAVAAGISHTVGLKSDGTVVAVGNNDDGRCNVSEWADIVAISAGDSHTVGLKSDGTVVAVGSKSHGMCDVAEWKNIVDVQAGSLQTIGLKIDHTVVATGDNLDGQCNVKSWSEIESVSSEVYHTVAVKLNSSVVATGNNSDGQCDVFDLIGIKKVATGYANTVCLRYDGTIVVLGDEYKGQYDAMKWNNIADIAVGSLHIVGLKSNGTVVAVGLNRNNQCNVSGWKDIKLPKK